MGSIQIPYIQGVGADLMGAVQLELLDVALLRGNHLSNTTCLTRVFFKSGE